MNSKEVMSVSSIIPVLAIEDINHALPLAKALLKGGIPIMEITLRTACALEAIQLIRKECPSMFVGAGTVCNCDELLRAKEHGAQFVFSPGISQALIECSKKEQLALIPGVSTASEVMLAQNNGLYFCKLFPATLSGGVDILKAFSGPFSKMHFCPTGGVNKKNIKEFLELKNVLCVGGTWIVPQQAIHQGDFHTITQLCQEAIQIIKG